jgi:SpoVK/Ycf46/Vps4 family AAA+-type ATPase
MGLRERARHSWLEPLLLAAVQMAEAFVCLTISVLVLKVSNIYPLLAFFMRKGADVLSKWVGEAERQLRLLFEEARAVQPSIIFFDEIDGLAPVRSSKQDQIHASIVSTLLALMDGMDGRGQVVVIGATNRPDAVDPALRRPGRFDREFYFPLPGLEARERILSIMTKKWKGWEGPEADEMIKGLAKMTKGYGGADLRVRIVFLNNGHINSLYTGVVHRSYAQFYPEALSSDLPI